MLKQSRMDIRDTLARKAIKAVYNINLYKEQESYVNLFQQYLSQSGGYSQASTFFKHSWLKQMRFLIMVKLTNVLITTLPAEQQKMSKLYYGPSSKQQCGIYTDLHISQTTLSNWDLKLLNKVFFYAFKFRISKDDVFYLPRLVNTVKFLSDFVALAQKLDPSGKLDLVSPGFLDNANLKLVNYREIISIIGKHKENDRESMLSMIVSTKAKHPDATAAEIGAKCFMDPTLVSKNIRTFQKSISQYLVV